MYFQYSNHVLSNIVIIFWYWANLLERSDFAVFQAFDRISHFLGNFNLKTQTYAGKCIPNIITDLIEPINTKNSESNSQQLLLPTLQRCGIVWTGDHDHGGTECMHYIFNSTTHHDVFESILGYKLVFWKYIYQV